MKENSLPDCLGCSDEESRLQVAFPKAEKGNRAESPTGLWKDRTWWCRPCWTLREPYARFDLLYRRALWGHTRKRLAHLPARRREVAADDVTSQVMLTLWEKQDQIRTPERAMYRVAEYTAMRLFPYKEREEASDLLEQEESAQDPTETLVDVLVLEEELAKLSEKERKYLVEHIGLGKTAEEVASSHGVAKGTVTVSAGRALKKMRPAFEIIRYGVVGAVMRMIIDWILMMLG
ncbi:RNA polymerase sigma factor [Streptomyces virginiae]|uniref:RNA polymerase sigma factor n=1 Tax=Streptomyces virginiae TaxID=1961 RepID=UPI0036CEA4B3